MSDNRCPECGTFAGGDPKLIYNPDGDNYPCPVCRSTGKALHSHYAPHWEPVQAGAMDCPLCSQPLPNPDAAQYEPQDVSGIAF